MGLLLLAARLPGFWAAARASRAGFASNKTIMMLRLIYLFIAIFVGGFSGLAQIVTTTQAPGRQMPEQKVVLLRNARVIDGTGAVPREHVSLLLRDGKIEQIGGPEIVAPAGAQVGVLTGKRVL